MTDDHEHDEDLGRQRAYEARGAIGHLAAEVQAAVEHYSDASRLVTELRAWAMSPHPQACPHAVPDRPVVGRLGDHSHAVRCVDCAWSEMAIRRRDRRHQLLRRVPR